MQITKRSSWRTPWTTVSLLSCWICLLLNAAAAPPPAIAVQPRNQTVQVGGNATFVVEARSGTTLSYQWYFQTNAIPGATNNTYTRANAQLTDAGVYYVVVWNDGGTVNSTSAVLTVLTLLVTNTNDSGAGSLRQAILDANAAAGTNTITFNIAGAGVRTIVPASVLPDITDAVVIDATSQPGYSGTPLIELNGAGAGNDSAGLVLAPGSSGSTIRGLAVNHFGTGGIHINQSSGNLIEHNLVAFNGTGIEIFNDAATGNAILGNSIFSNGGLGIDLGTSGVTANDSGDGDTGPNNLQNFPVLSAACAQAALVTIEGTLHSKANSYFRIEFFASTAADASGYGEGARYLGFASVRTDAFGNAAIDTTLAATVAAGEFVSATATKSDNTFTTFTDTSEFAGSVITVLPADVVTVLDGPQRVDPLANFTYTVTVSNRGPSAARSVVASATLSSNLTFASASAGGTYLGGVVTWPAMASLGIGASTNWTVGVKSPVRGVVKSSASSTAATWDPDLTDNDGSATDANVLTTVSPLTVTNSGSGAVAATLNWSHTISPGSARILIVGVSINDPTTTVIAATFANLLPLTPIGHTDGTQTKVLMYYLLNPPVGTFPISISLDTSAGIVGGAVSCNDVSQADPIAGFAGNTGTGTNASVTVAGSLGGVVIDTVAPKSPARANFPGPAQTLAWNVFAANYSGAGSTLPGNAAVSPSWKLTGATTAWAMAAVAINPVIVFADIALTVTGPSTVVATSNLTYSITVTNRGLDTATNVVVSDALPAGATFVSASGGGTVKSGVVTWPALPNFVKGAKANYTVTVTAPATGPLTNLAYSTSTTADPDPSNNNGTGNNNQVVTTVVPLADVATTVTGPAYVLAATDFSYTLSLTNAGPSPAAGVVVSDTLPAGATFVNASGGGTQKAGVVTWPPLAILPSEAALNFTVTVTAPASGTLTNTVASTSAATDPVPSNNDGTAAAARAVTVVFPPAVLTGRLLPGGAFQMELNTLPDATCTFLVSTNLVDWVTLVTTNSVDGHVVFIDQDILIYPQRFYRSLQKP